jgi:hypothetical protein
VTPTYSAITPEELAHGGITFRVVLAGHVPYSWTQGASSEDVRIDAALEPLTITALPPSSGDTVIAEPTTSMAHPPSTTRRPPRTTGTTMVRPPDDDLRSSR